MVTEEKNGAGSIIQGFLIILWRRDNFYVVFVDVIEIYKRAEQGLYTALIIGARRALHQSGRIKSGDDQDDSH